MARAACFAYACGCVVVWSRPHGHATASVLFIGMGVSPVELRHLQNDECEFALSQLTSV